MVTERYHGKAITFTCPICGETKEGRSVSSRKRCIECTRLMAGSGYYRMSEAELDRTIFMALRRLRAAVSVRDERRAKAAE